MANINLVLAGNVSGTGAYNPVPASISLVTPTTIKLYKIVGTSSKFIGSIPNLSMTWDASLLIGSSVNFVFAETVLASGSVQSVAFQNLITNSAQPSFSPSGTLFTGVTTAVGGLNMLANLQG